MKTSSVQITWLAAAHSPHQFQVYDEMTAERIAANPRLQLQKDSKERLKVTTHTLAYLHSEN